MAAAGGVVTMSPRRLRQLSPWTPGSQLYDEDTIARELRVIMCETMERIVGGVDVSQRCPQCGGGLRVVLDPEAPTAWCRCGFVRPLRGAS